MTFKISDIFLVGDTPRVNKVLLACKENQRHNHPLEKEAELNKHFIESPPGDDAFSKEERIHIKDNSISHNKKQPKSLVLRIKDLDFFPIFLESLE